MNTQKYNIAVDAKANFVAQHSSPNQSRYFFSYDVVIKNEGSVPAQLLTRHWRITNGNGLVHEVRGDGVIGEQPMLAPNESFTYTSACPIDTPMGFMEGSYQMQAEDGTKFDAPIEVFILNSGEVMH
jgi:ApaG protein